MSLRKKVVTVIIVLAIGWLGFSIWYRYQFSMDMVETYEVNPQIQNQNILIATQGSDFKNALVQKIVKHYGSQSIYIKVTDVSNLGKVDESVWNAILILHTWENWEPQPDAKFFLNRVKNKNKVIVLATSSSGYENLNVEGIDGITGASEMDDVPDKVEEIKNRLDAVLGL